MATFTERLALIIDAKTGGAATAFRQVGAAADDLGERSGIADRAVAKVGLSGVVSGQQLKAGLAVGATAAGFAFAKFSADAVSAASALEEQVTATGQVFGRAAGEMLDFGDDAATSLGISNRAALQAANGFGDLFVKLGKTPEQAATLSKGLVTLASDLASFKDLSVDDALQKLQSGLAGESEPLRSVGVFLNETKVKAKAAELGLGGMHRELTEGEKVMARYAIILDETGSAQGDMGRTSDSLANQQRMLRAEYEDLQAAIGTLLIPAVQSLTSTVVDALGPLIDYAEGLDRTRKSGSLWGQIVDGLVGGWSGLKTEQEQAAESAEDTASIYEALGPILGNTAQQATTLAGAFQHLGGLVRDLAAAGVQGEERTRSLADAMEAAQDADETYSDALEAVSDAQEGVRQAQEEVARSSGESAQAQEEAAERIVRAQRAIEDANERVSDSYHAIEQAQERARRANHELAESQEKIADLQRTYDQALADFGPNHHLTVEASEELSDAQYDLSTRQYDAQEAAYAVQEAQEDLADAERDLRDAQDELTEAHDRGTVAQDRSREAAENLSDAQERLRDAEREAARAAEEAEEAHRKEQEALDKAGASAGSLLEQRRQFVAQHPEYMTTFDEQIAKLDLTAAAYDRMRMSAQLAYEVIGDAIANGPAPVFDFFGLGGGSGQAAASVMSGQGGGRAGTVINVFPAPGQSAEEIGREIAWNAWG